MNMGLFKIFDNYFIEMETTRSNLFLNNLLEDEDFKCTLLSYLDNLKHFNLTLRKGEEPAKWQLKTWREQAILLEMYFLTITKKVEWTKAMEYVRSDKEQGMAEILANLKVACSQLLEIENKEYQIRYSQASVKEPEVYYVTLGPASWFLSFAGSE